MGFQWLDLADVKFDSRFLHSIFTVWQFDDEKKGSYNFEYCNQVRIVILSQEFFGVFRK